MVQVLPSCAFPPWPRRCIPSFLCAPCLQAPSSAGSPSHSTMQAQRSATGSPQHAGAHSGCFRTDSPLRDTSHPQRSATDSPQLSGTHAQQSTLVPTKEPTLVPTKEPYPMEPNPHCPDPQGPSCHGPNSHGPNSCGAGVTEPHATGGALWEPQGDNITGTFFIPTRGLTQPWLSLITWDMQWDSLLYQLSWGPSNLIGAVHAQRNPTFGPWVLHQLPCDLAVLHEQTDKQREAQQS